MTSKWYAIFKGIECVLISFEEVKMISFQEVKMISFQEVKMIKTIIPRFLHAGPTGFWGEHSTRSATGALVGELKIS